MIQEADRLETEEDSENDQERIRFLTSFVSRLMNAPTKTKSSEVDVVVTKEEIRIVANYSAASFAAMNSLTRVDEKCLPIHIVGDLHGHFSDLRSIFERFVSIFRPTLIQFTDTVLQVTLTMFFLGTTWIEDVRD